MHNTNAICIHYIQYYTVYIYTCEVAPLLPHDLHIAGGDLGQGYHATGKAYVYIYYMCIHECEIRLG